MNYLHLIWDYILQYLKSRMIYRMDFFNEILSDLLMQAVSLIFILVVFQHTPAMAGWSQAEVIFIYGYFLIPYAIFTTFFNLWDFNDRYIIKGEMDRVLTRPIHNLAQIVLERTQPEAMFGVITGFIIMGYAASQLELSFAWYDPFILLLLVLGSVGVYAGIYVAIASIGFYSDSRTGIAPMIWNIQNYGRYPLDVYNKLIRFVLTWILPFAYVGMYPSAYFLQREAWYVYSMATPLVGIIVFFLGLIIWNFGVRQYRGAGS
ncbi:ABC transporter permease [Caldalkalibacillus mannanilyticus]|uniref:ABC transporter permease n=1 Tax=Caldalkalibacillus mannanilyticus TaxID=1418 RepID=UPI000469DEE2|nr:ABC-2 family transporter protein [Caldalkalibacillus mannanilyticus]